MTRPDDDIARLAVGMAFLLAIGGFGLLLDVLPQVLS